MWSASRLATPAEISRFSASPSSAPGSTNFDCLTCMLPRGARRNGVDLEEGPQPHHHPLRPVGTVAACGELGGPQFDCRRTVAEDHRALGERAALRPGTKVTEK
jgi:hypothetical protein